MGSATQNPDPKPLQNPKLAERRRNSAFMDGGWSCPLPPWAMRPSTGRPQTSLCQAQVPQILSQSFITTFIPTTTLVLPVTSSQHHLPAVLAVACNAGAKAQQTHHHDQDNHDRHHCEHVCEYDPYCCCCCCRCCCDCPLYNTVVVVMFPMYCRKLVILHLIAAIIDGVIVIIAGLIGFAIWHSQSFG